jgi:HAD superfamily phosphoserine phosphatase-like hydrolase
MVVHAVIDFDDTLSRVNVATQLFRRFTDEDAVREIRSSYVAGEITFREYQEKCFDMFEVDINEIAAAAKTEASLRDGATELISSLNKQGGKSVIATAGLDVYVDPVLSKTGLGHLKVHSGKVKVESPALPPFRYDYPSANSPGTKDGCLGDWVTCKCRVVSDLKSDNPDDEIIFIGDGLAGDSCVAVNAEVTLFATGRLKKFCETKEITFHEFDDNFRPVINYINETSTTNREER